MITSNPHTEDLISFLKKRCDKCHGRGEVDLNVCHGFGHGPRTYWPCTACDGTGIRKEVVDEQEDTRRETD